MHLNTTTPTKLTVGDHIRVLSPSSSVASIGGFDANLPAKARLEALGFVVSFSKNYFKHDVFGSASIQDRVDDIHEAFLDNSVKAILATIGGFNCNELLPYLDYDLIKNNPKIICGYSDTTALLNAIYAKTGLITYMGASYSSFKMDVLQDYQSTMWLNAMTQTHYTLIPSKYWSSDAWYLPNALRTLFDTQWKIYTHGIAQGVIIGGNLATFCLLNGTPFAPKSVIENQAYVLFLEAAEGYTPQDILRQFTAVMQNYPDPQALILGRFPKECQINEPLLHEMLSRFAYLKTIPVIYDTDFAHTQPLFTMGIGAMAYVDTQKLCIECFETTK